MTFYITTAIDYTNGPPHIGHAYEKILADVIARYRRLRGDNVFFLTGVDQHGQKVQQAAEKAGIPPQEFASRISELFIALWKKLGVQPDGWASTTDPRHKTAVRKTLQTLFEKGDLYKANYSGFYSLRAEQFLTDKERGPDGLFGSEWGEVVELQEENWYLKLSPHRDWLKNFVESHADCVLPSFRRTELKHAIERLSGDLSISRPKTRLSWGIELPFDTDYVTYVWFDALLNYLTFAGYLAEPDAGLPEFKPLWSSRARHVIGKDILSPAHGIYWPIMLHVLGFPDEEIPQLLVHGWWNIAGAKMSKSEGNVIDPDLLADRYGADALRYYLMRDISLGQDADFSEERLWQRYNADLANGLGNLLNRSLSMAARYRQSSIRNRPHEDSAMLELRNLAASVAGGYALRMDEYQVHAALEAVWELVTRCNSFVESSAPWKLAKDPAAADQLDAVLYHLCESLRIVAVLISPILPAASAAIFSQLQAAPAAGLDAAKWGGLGDAHLLGQPSPLFPRIDQPCPA